MILKWRSYRVPDSSVLNFRERVTYIFRKIISATNFWATLDDIVVTDKVNLSRTQAQGRENKYPDFARLRIFAPSEFRYDDICYKTYEPGN